MSVPPPNDGPYSMLWQTAKSSFFISNFYPFVSENMNDFNDLSSLEPP